MEMTRWSGLDDCSFYQHFLADQWAAASTGDRLSLLQEAANRCARENGLPSAATVEWGSGMDRWTSGSQLGDRIWLNPELFSRETQENPNGNLEALLTVLHEERHHWQEKSGIPVFAANNGSSYELPSTYQDQYGEKGTSYFDGTPVGSGECRGELGYALYLLNPTERDANEWSEASLKSIVSRLQDNGIGVGDETFRNVDSVCRYQKDKEAAVDLVMGRCLGEEENNPYLKSEDYPLSRDTLTQQMDSMFLNKTTPRNAEACGAVKNVFYEGASAVYQKSQEEAVNSAKADQPHPAEETSPALEREESETAAGEPEMKPAPAEEAEKGPAAEEPGMDMSPAPGGAEKGPEPETPETDMRPAPAEEAEKGPAAEAPGMDMSPAPGGAEKGPEPETPEMDMRPASPDAEKGYTAEEPEMDMSPAPGGAEKGPEPETPEMDMRPASPETEKGPAAEEPGMNMEPAPGGADRGPEPETPEMDMRPASPETEKGYTAEEPEMDMAPASAAETKGPETESPGEDASSSREESPDVEPEVSM